MRRIRLVLAYDGTNYSGWQFQKNAVTIEEVLNKALSQLMGEEIAVIGASRTDAGVHALENVAVFDTENRMAADKICLALNQWLPEDIRALRSEETAPDWHPRKQNCTKTYEYRILNRKINMPTERLYSYFCYFPLDVEKMKKGAAYLVGEHDFRSFCAPRGQAEETVRTIYSLSIDKKDDMITLRISGSGFLYNMVRIIAGTLIKVGIGVYPPEHVEEILDARDRRAAGPTAPAKGLTLVSMEYERQLRERITGENKDWAYELIQSEILTTGKAYLIIRRCAGRDFDRLLLRVTHQAVRNGAREVYACDLEGGRIDPERSYGYYEFQRAEPGKEEMREAEPWQWFVTTRSGYPQGEKNTEEEEQGNWLQTTTTGRHNDNNQEDEYEDRDRGGRCDHQTVDEEEDRGTGNGLSGGGGI